MTLTAGIDRVLVIPDDIEEQSESGLFLTYARTQNPTSGVVAAVGKGDLQSMEGVKVGDRVAFKDMAGSEFEHKGQRYWALFYSEVLAVLPGE